LRLIKGPSTDQEIEKVNKRNVARRMTGFEFMMTPRPGVQEHMFKPTPNSDHIKLESLELGAVLKFIIDVTEFARKEGYQVEMNKKVSSTVKGLCNSKIFRIRT